MEGGREGGRWRGIDGVREGGGGGSETGQPAPERG